MKILITGPQGSGKTTQSQMVAQRLSLCLIDSGDLVRDKSQEDSEVGRNLKDSLAKGLLSNDAVVADLVKKKISEESCQDRLVMDGYPRELHQLDFFDPKFDKAFYLELSDAEALERLLKRGRADDTPELIRTRLAIYHKRTEPVLDYYRKQGILTTVDGSQSIKAITEAIIKSL